MYIVLHLESDYKTQNQPRRFLHLPGALVQIAPHPPVHYSALRLLPL